MTDLNEIKAGKYQLVAQSWDHITSKPSEPLDFTRYVRGDIVELNVEDAKRLFAAGAVVLPGQLEKAAVERARAEFELAQTQLNALLAGLPDDVRSEVAPNTVSQEPDGSGTEPFDGLNRGSGTDAWRTFAVSEAAGEKRLTADEAGAKSRDELAELFMGPKESA